VDIVLVLGPNLFHWLLPRLVWSGPNDPVVQILSLIILLEQLGQDGELGVGIIIGKVLHKLVQDFLLQPLVLRFFQHTAQRRLVRG